MDIDGDELLSCGVCAEDYQASGNLVPVTLPCGHTFCRSCLANVEKAGRGLICPTCRYPHPTATVGLVAKLSPSYTILNLLENRPQSCQFEKCVSHGEPLGFWCRQCSSLACGLCIYEAHREGVHVVVSVKTVLEEKKQFLEKETNRFKHVIETELLSGIRKSVVDILNAVRRSTEVAKLKVEISNTKGLICRAMSMETLLLCEAKHSSLQDSFENSGLVSGSRSLESEAKDVTPPMYYSEHFLDSQSHSQGATSKQRKEVGLLSCSVIHSEAVSGYITWDGQHFLLHSFGYKKHKSEFTITWSMLSTLGPIMKCTAFLELVGGNQFLGRVVIRLWGHLRRAQHFMGLCLGLWGGSFKGSCFSRVHETQHCKFLVGGSYRAEDGRGFSTAGMMEDLEWDGDHAGDDSEGQLVSFGGGHAHLDSVFGICVVEKTTGGRSRCPFGEVVSGFDVVQKAATFVPSTQVAITQCGVILSRYPEGDGETDVSSAMAGLDI